MASAQNGPVPTQLVLLSELSKCKAGSKVRFLGWLVMPKVRGGIAMSPCACDGLPHFTLCSIFVIFCDNFLIESLADAPRSVTSYSTKTASLVLEHDHPPSNAAKAVVDIKLLVTTLKGSETRIGEWVNVMGYIQTQQQSAGQTSNSHSVQVQALVLWSSGPFSLDRYERCLESKRT